MEIARSIEIEQPVAAVFAFVADARNDPSWCPKVKSVTQLFERGSGPKTEQS